MTGGGTSTPLWVFGYGSLMWQPGFVYDEVRRVRLDGYRRAFCVYSLHYRGTARRPGLVLGLMRGGTCEGVAFRVADAEAPAVRAYLHQRELIYGVYREATLPAELHGPGSARIEVLTYVAEPRHPSYAGAMPAARQAAMIRGARGVAGSNLAYLVSTLRKLAALGIRQPELERVALAAGVADVMRRDSPVRCLESRCAAFAGRPAPRKSIVIARPHAFAFRRALPG